MSLIFGKVVLSNDKFSSIEKTRMSIDVAKPTSTQPTLKSTEHPSANIRNITLKLLNLYTILH